MPYTKINLKNGYYTEDTRADSSDRWIDGDKMRFVTDVPQKIGGWNKLSTNKYLGICRAITSWPTFENNKYLAFGTNLKLYTYYQGTYWDITPFQSSGFFTSTTVNNVVTFQIATTNGTNVVTITQPNNGLVSTDLVLLLNVEPFNNVTINGIYPIVIVDANTYTIAVGTLANATGTGGGFFSEYTYILTLTNPFTTINGSPIINVHQTNHGLTINTFVSFINASIVGGLNLNGTFQVYSIVDADNYTIISTSNATSSATGGGTVNYLYEIVAGAVDTVIGFGYGTGTYGTGTYGTPRQDQGVILDFPRVWSLDIWNDDLIACARDLGIYYWPHQVDTPIIVPAAKIPNSPAQAKVIAVWPEAQILVAFGCTDLLGNYNPLNIRWSTFEDYTDWTPTSTNSAGEFGLTSGTEIIAVAKMRGQMLIATDTTLYSMYGDPIDVFAFKVVGNCQILSPNCMVEVNGIVYIMGENQFYVYDGTLNTIVCEVRRHVFENINQSQTFKVYGAILAAYNEVWWFYPSSNSMDNDSYVVYNYQKNIFYFGTMERTAYIEVGTTVPTPVAAGPAGTSGVNPLGYLYTHEVGYNDDGNPMFAYIQSGDMVIDQRNRFIYIKNLVPDILETNAPVNLTITASRFPQSNMQVFGPYTILPNTDVIGTRIKGGQFSFKWETDALNAVFEVGSLEMLVIPTGTK